MAIEIDMLEQALMRERQQDLPLHSQVRRALRRLIQDDFNNGDRFFTETAIAEKLNVSAGTVRRALADLTREGLLVRRVAQGTFVRKPDSAGSDVKTVLRVLLPQYDSEMFSCLLEALEREAGSRHLAMEVYRTPRGQSAAEVVAAIRHTAAEARIILLGTLPSMTSELNEFLEARGFRTVTIDTLVAGFKGRYVGTDNLLAARIGLEHLVGLGHRHIAFLVNEPNDQLTVVQRIAGFQKYAAELRVENAEVILPEMERWQNAFDVAYNAMADVWNKPDRPSAIMTMSDYGAFGVMKWLGEHEVHIPREVSVVGFENVPSGRFTHPALTTIAHPVVALARRAIDMLWEESVYQEFLEPELVSRESTAEVFSSISGASPVRK